MFKIVQQRDSVKGKGNEVWKKGRAVLTAGALRNLSLSRKRTKREKFLQAMEEVEVTVQYRFHA